MGNSPEIIHFELEPDLDAEPEKLCEHGTWVSIKTSKTWSEWINDGLPGDQPHCQHYYYIM